MATYELLESILTNGIRNTHYFNGRALSAEDLKNDQDAIRRREEHYGMALGDGVVHGLLVSESPDSTAANPMLQITAGLAINRKGQALHLDLPEPLTLRLIAQQAQEETEAGLFAPCRKLKTKTFLTNPGFYLLTISPVSGFEGRVPQYEDSAFGVTNINCISKYAVEGIRFRLININLDGLGADDKYPASTAAIQAIEPIDTPAKLSKLRNVLAHMCFGTEELLNFYKNPFQVHSDEQYPLEKYGLLDHLRARDDLTECDVPLALMSLIATGIEFIDLWAVRRVMSSGFIHSDWHLLLSPRTKAESEAIFLQFQHQLSHLRSTLSLSLASVEAAEYFKFLPPAGFVPVRGVGSLQGFQQNTFFGELTSGGMTFIQHDKVKKMIYEALLHRPVDVDLQGMLQIYRVWENGEAVAGSESAQLYCIFTSREVHDVKETDNLARALYGCWQAYKGLIKKRVFLPNEASSDAIGARIIIMSAIQHVMAVAIYNAGLAGAQNLGYQDGLNAFQNVYEIQKELVEIFLDPIPGITDPQDRINFAEALNTYLESAGPGGNPPLLPSITAQNLQNAVKAQGAINGFIESWTGEGAAIGFITVEYAANSPRGIQLVPEDPEPYPHHFYIRNHTDRRLTIQLDIEINAPRGDWSNSVIIRNLAGQQIDSVSLSSGQTREVIVEVTVADEVEIDDTVILTVFGSVPQPHNKSDSDSLEMIVAEEGGGAINRNVQFTQVLAPSDTSDVEPGEFLNYAFDMRYTASEEPFVADFQFRVEVPPDSGTVLEQWFVQFIGIMAGNPSPGVYTTEVSLDSNATSDTRITVRIRAPFSRGTVNKTITFTATIESLELTPAISDTEGPFSITLRTESAG